VREPIRGQGVGKRAGGRPPARGVPGLRRGEQLLGGAHRAVRSRRLTAMSAHPTPHIGRAGASLSNASRQTETTLSWTTSAKRRMRASRSGSGGPAHSPPPGPADRREVGVVPVEQDRLRRRTGRLGDTIEQQGDLRLADPDDVDAADDCTAVVLLDGDRRRLEAEAAVAGDVVRLPHEADGGQAERRLERMTRCTDEKLAAHRLSRKTRSRSDPSIGSGAQASRRCCFSAPATSSGTSSAP